MLLAPEVTLSQASSQVKTPGPGDTIVRRHRNRDLEHPSIVLRNAFIVINI